ncbi:MAG TPA: hypothetical protein VJ756_09990 [Terriglobales bacterium]|nr:hypothetical protein [Terriglobales bacterium]
MHARAFDLQLPEDCYLSLLIPFTSVMIAIFPETKVNGTSAISDLRTVRVRGWLFYFNDEFAMVRTRSFHQRSRTHECSNEHTSSLNDHFACRAFCGPAGVFTFLLTRDY